MTACVTSPTDTATPFAATAMRAQPAPLSVNCPAGLRNATRCHAGRDSEGAFVLIATPQPWNGLLVLHGQSWRAGVAAKAAELFTADATGGRPCDAVLLTSSVLGRGARSQDFRLDLRVI